MSSEEYGEGEGRVVVVAARSAWPLYKATSVYVCQNRRSFQKTERMAFYANRVIYPSYPLILDRMDDVDLSHRGAARQSLSADCATQMLGRTIRRILMQGWEEDTVSIFKLTAPTDPRTITNEPIPHPGRTGWVMGHRYAQLSSLQTATSTDDVA